MAQTNIEREYKIAWGFVQLSGIDPKEYGDTIRVAESRALHILHQQRLGKPIHPYQGRNPGIINVATESIVLTIRRRWGK